MYEHRQLFLNQSTSWALAAKNYRALSEIISREFQMEGFRIKLQFNPGRINSSSANISKEAIQARPCFLCAKNRPPEQESLTFVDKNIQSSDTRFEILVNPFPVFPQHFTIVATDHQPQTIRGNFDAFLRLAKKMNDCVIFYNGPKCGASAPDHLHFQAGSKGLMPLESDYEDWSKTNLTPVWKDKNSNILKMENLQRNGWVMEGNDSSDLVQHFGLLLDLLESANKLPGEEPMLNLLCWCKNENWTCILFPRKAHRPKCYFREDETKLLISPASVEMGGLMIAARQEDFERIEAADIRKIYNDVSVSKAEINLISDQFIDNKR